MEVSGPAWCDRFPTSTSLDDLAKPFQDGVRAFVGSMKDAGAAVVISATYRPPERAYLMHWACKIAQSKVEPAEVPPMDGVAIDWTHGGDTAKARAAARLMKAKYNIAFPAALVSRHTQRRAVDMTPHWKGVIHVKDGRGVMHAVSRIEDLYPIGASYGVKKLPSDPPHWSDDGH